MKKSKIVIVIMLVALSVFLLCGCNFIDNASSLEYNELTTASLFGGNDNDARNYNSLIKEFERQNNIKIKDSSTSSSDAWKKTILRQFETGSEPDVVFFFNDATAEPLINSNKVVSIAEIRTEYPGFANNIDEKYLENGYSVPIRTYAQGLFYNKDLFKKLGAGIEPPKTFDELLSVVELINQKNETLNPRLKKIPISFGASDNSHYMIENMLLSVLGGEEYAKYPYEDAEEKAQASEKYLEAIKKIGELEECGAFGDKKCTEKSYAAAKNEFLTGNSYMFVDNSWLQPSSENHISIDNIGVIPFPLQEIVYEYQTDEEGELVLDEEDNPIIIGDNYGENIITGCASGYFISRKAWNDASKRVKAVKFVEYMTKTDNVLKFGSMTTLKANQGTGSTGNIIQRTFKRMVSNSTNQYEPLESKAQNFSFNYLVDAMKVIVDYGMTQEGKAKESINKFLNY